MSLGPNISFGPEEILVLTDTLTYSSSKKPMGLCRTKAYISENGGFAWAHRGTMLFHECTIPELTKAQSLDEALHFLRGVLDRYERSMGPSGEEYHVFGYSGGKPRVVRAARYKGDEYAEVELEHGIHLNPRPNKISIALPQTVPADKMVKLALVQHKIQDKYDFPMCIGGVMHITSITKDGIRKWEAEKYPDYSQHARMFTDPEGHIRYLTYVRENGVLQGDHRYLSDAELFGALGKVSAA